MEILRERLDKAMESIDKTTNLFYQNKINVGYEQLELTLVSISEVINEVFLYKQQGKNIGIDEAKLIDILTEAMKAMEMKDTLLLSDLLVYELRVLFNQIIASL